MHADILSIHTLHPVSLQQTLRPVHAFCISSVAYVQNDCIIEPLQKQVIPQTVGSGACIARLNHALAGLKRRCRSPPTGGQMGHSFIYAEVSVPFALVGSKAEVRPVVDAPLSPPAARDHSIQGETGPCFGDFAFCTHQVIILLQK